MRIDPQDALSLARQGPIRWHSTTASRFECKLGCSCCCLNAFFFPSEERLLPAPVKQFLSFEDRVVRPRLKSIRDQPRCIFFDLSTPKHCLIHEHRPLRCELYPFLPVIENQGLLIIAEPFLDLKQTGFGVEEWTPDWARCYGLGEGEDVRREVERKCRLFIEKVALERPDYLEKLTIDQVNNKLNAKEVRKHTRPEYFFFYEYGPLPSYPQLDLETRLTKLAGEMAATSERPI